MAGPGPVPVAGPDLLLVIRLVFDRHDIKHDTGERAYTEGTEDFGEEMYFYARSYCPDPALVRHPYISPLVDGDFGGLPPAYLVSAEYDDLQQDSVRYAERLRHHGVPVQLVIEPGLVHAPVRGRWLIPQMADSWRRYGEAMAAMAAD